MCGRFTLSNGERVEELSERVGIPARELAEAGLRPRWNVAPTDLHPIIRMEGEDRHALPAKWGLVQFGSKDAKRAAMQINARAESIATRPAFRNAWAKARRCAVPADGFFEWVGPKEARQPIWFHRPDGETFFFAGLYESWQPAPDQWQRTFTIITTSPNATLSSVHDRMPVILAEGDIDEWLFRSTPSDEVARLLAPAPDELLVATPVSTRVNSVRNDDPGCLEPVDFAL